jgi:hypothetical protein
MERKQEWDYATYNVEPGNHTIEWKFSRGLNSSSTDDAAWLDDISLPVHEALFVEPGAGGFVCQGDSYTPESQAGNYNSILWTSDGDGSFNDKNLLKPEYLPGPEDIKNGSVLLSMQVNGFDGCDGNLTSVLIYPSPLPEIYFPTDTIASFNTPLVLDASSVDAGSWLWLPGNETTPIITVDTIGLDRGSKTEILQIKSSNGCMAQKMIRIHFPASADVPAFNVYPNPCTDFFTIEPEMGAAMLDRVSLYNSKGEIVWQKADAIEIIDHRDFLLPDLPAATYYLVAVNHSGQSIKTLVIK